MKAFISLINIFIALNIFSSIITNPSYEEYSFLFLEKFKIGPKSKEINMILNSITSKSVLFTNSKRDYSQEIQRNRKSDVLIDKLNFNGEIIPSFPFNLKLDETKLNNPKIQGEFGLGIDKDNSNVLVDTLYENKILKDKILEIEVLQEKNKDVLFLNFEPNMNGFTYCDLTSKLNENNFYSQAWICNISHVIIGSDKGELTWNKTIEVEGKAVFDTRTKYIYVPKNYMKYISTIWDINGEGCKIVLDEESDEKFFQCNSTMEKSIYSMPSIYFIIDGYGYRLKPEHLFEKDGENFIGLIRFINEEEDLWVLGIPFLREYKLLLDYNKTRVGLSGENVMNYKEEYEKWQVDTAEKKSKLFSGYTCETIIFIIGTIIGLCIISYVVFWLYRNWRRANNKYKLHEEIQFKKEEIYN
jgi:hypothetical protein